MKRKEGVHTQLSLPEKAARGAGIGTGYQRWKSGSERVEIKLIVSYPNN
jgi:hypothetical protein